eukprot:305378-Amphidinium_carterae.3
MGKGSYRHRSSMARVKREMLLSTHDICHAARSTPEQVPFQLRGLLVDDSILITDVSQSLYEARMRVMEPDKR